MPNKIDTYIHELEEHRISATRIFLDENSPTLLYSTQTSHLRVLLAFVSGNPVSWNPMIACYDSSHMYLSNRNLECQRLFSAFPGMCY